jgi:hypothetical protein
MQTRGSQVAAGLAMGLFLHCGGEIAGNGSNSAFGSGGAGATTEAKAAAAGRSEATGSGPAPVPSTGGVSTSASSGGSPTGNATSAPVAATGGRTVKPAPACTPALNLLAGDLGPENNWIGGEPNSTIDNPCGLQGLIYIFGDVGLDNVPGTADDTCPFMDQAVSPCSAGRCCVSGRTHRWPRPDGLRDDYLAPVWGCGIGFSLNDPADGRGTLPYSGPVKGFRIELSGWLNGQVVHIGYTQVAATSIAPFRQVTSTDEYEVAFADPSVACPTWGDLTSTPSTVTTRYCIPPGPHPHALQVWIVGGDTDGEFELCIEGLYPML